MIEAFICIKQYLRKSSQISTYLLTFLIEFGIIVVLLLQTNKFSYHLTIENTNYSFINIFQKNTDQIQD